MLRRADGQEYGKRVFRELLPYIRQHFVEVGVLAIHLRDAEDDGLMVVQGVLPGAAGLDLHPAHGADQQQRRVRDADSGAHLAREVRKTGSIQGKQGLPPPLHREEGGADRDLPFLLLGLKVADGVARIRPAHAPDLPIAEKHGLGQGGLSGPAVGDKRKTSRVLRLTCSHPPIPSS